MKFVRFPAHGLNSGLSHAERSILLNLCMLQFTYCGPYLEREFFITDRDLAYQSKCSTSTVFRAKQKFVQSGILKFSVGEKNKTYYKLNPKFWR